MNNTQKINKFIFVATPTKFQLRYRNFKGEIKDYLTTPIEMFPDSFVGYVFGSGIRSFRHDRIVDIQTAELDK